MWQTMVIGAERAQQIGDGASLCGFGGTATPNWVGGAIAAAVLCPHHALGHDGDLAVERSRSGRQQIVVSPEQRYLGFNAVSIRRDRAAQCGHSKMLRNCANDLRAFSAADPGREGKWLGVNILEACRFQSGLGPCDRALMGFGAGQRLSDLGGQRFHEIEGGWIVERFLSEARCGGNQRTRRRRVGGYRHPSANRERSHSDQKAEYLAHQTAPSPNSTNCNI